MNYGYGNYGGSSVPYPKIPLGISHVLLIIVYTLLCVLRRRLDVSLDKNICENEDREIIHQTKYGMFSKTKVPDDIKELSGEEKSEAYKDLFKVQENDLITTFCYFFTFILSVMGLGMISKSFRVKVTNNSKSLNIFLTALFVIGCLIQFTHFSYFKSNGILDYKCKSWVLNGAYVSKIEGGSGNSFIPGYSGSSSEGGEEEDEGEGDDESDEGEGGDDEESAESDEVCHVPDEQLTKYNIINITSFVLLINLISVASGWMTR